MEKNIIDMVPVKSSPKSNNLYVFGWPSHLGGADTKLHNTLCLIKDFMNITVIPNSCHQLKEKYWYDLYTKEYGFKCISREEFIAMPSRLDGFALSLCNPSFISGCTLCKLAKEKDLKVLWGNEMMWIFEGELECIKNGYIDTVLLTSKFNEEQLAKEYFKANPSIEAYIVSNYINPKDFPFRERNNDRFTIGRLSRADVDKYSFDFPLFYESLELENPKYRVMAWDEKLKNMFKWHRFGSQWDLLKPVQEDTLDFLYSLDLFIYKLGHKFLESWGRSTVEAMLTGCVPIVPSGHNFNEFIIQGFTGFMCDSFEDFKLAAQEMQKNVQLRKKIAKQSSAYAASVVCNEEKHKSIWRYVFNV